MPFPFNKFLDLKLLEHVKENPCLYKPSNSKYTDWDTREVVWQKIGDILNRPAQMCKARWVNIRDMMRRKVRERIRNPGQHKYHYRYEEQLAFMMPYFKESALEHAPVEDFSEFEESCEVDESPLFLEQPEYVTEDDPITDAKNHSLKEEFNDTIFNERNSSFNDKNSSFNDKSGNFKDGQREFNSSTADSLDVFLLSIGSTLRKFSPYYLNQAKSKIFQVVQDYELEQMSNTDNRGSLSK